MAQERSVKLNDSRTREFLHALEKKPEGKTTFIYQAIIVSLIAHIFILFVTQMLTQDHREALDERTFMPLEMDMVEEIPPMEQQPEQSPRTGNLKNLIANENAQRTSEEKSYRGMTKDQINEEVYNNLKNMEAEEFAKLNEGRPDMTTAEKDKYEEARKNLKKSNDYDWYKNKSSTESYSGRVSAAFSMKGRDPLENPVPTYRCKTSGQVVVNVTIGSNGVVTDATINESSSSTDDCLRTESEKYARKWRFSFDANSRKQDGTITFTFSPQ